MRAQRRQLNRQVQYDNRLATFTAPPIQTGDLYVSGNLHVGRELHSVDYHASGNYYLHGYVLIPAGTIIQSAAINVPGGWLSCDGTQYSIEVYPDLFSAIEYTYGGGEGMFAVPDMRGRVAVGAVQNEETPYNLAATGGEETHTLTVGEIPAHSHTLTRRSNPDAGAYDTNNGHQDESSAATTDRDDLGTFSTYSTGGSQSHNNMQPYLVLRYLIKA